MLEAVRQGELIQVCRGVYANIHEEDAHAHIDTRKTGEHRPQQASHEERRYGR